MPRDDWDIDAREAFEIAPEASPYGWAGYDAWKAEELLDDPRAQLPPPTTRPAWLEREIAKRPRAVLEDMGLASGKCGLYVRKRDVRESEEFEWAVLTAEEQSR